jgi:hypothetical protein
MQMTLVRPKTDTREAWQYWPFISITQQWVLDCTEQSYDGMYLVRHSGKQLILPREWLVRNLDGEPEWMTDEAFRHEYDIID